MKEMLVAMLRMTVLIITAWTSTLQRNVVLLIHGGGDGGDAEGWMMLMSPEPKLLNC